MIVKHGSYLWRKNIFVNETKENANQNDSFFYDWIKTKWIEIIYWLKVDKYFIEKKKKALIYQINKNEKDPFSL